MRIFFHLGLIAVTHIAIAAEIPMGQYRGTVAGNTVEASVVIKPEGIHLAALLANSARCTGFVEFLISPSGDAFVGSPGVGCKITLQRRGAKLFVEEDHCENFHGAECNFEGVLKKISDTPVSATDYKKYSADKTAKFVDQVIPSATFVLDDKSQTVADCAYVMIYAANSYLMSNNEGAAKLMILQFARAQTALLFKFSENRIIKKDWVAAFTSNQQSNKAMLDANQSKLSGFINECVPIISDANDEQASTEKKVWGKDYVDMVRETAAQTRAQLGIH